MENSEVEILKDRIRVLEEGVHGIKQCAKNPVSFSYTVIISICDNILDSRDRVYECMNCDAKFNIRPDKCECQCEDFTTEFV